MSERNAAGPVVAGPARRSHKAPGEEQRLAEHSAIFEVAARIAGSVWGGRWVAAERSDEG